MEALTRKAEGCEIGWAEAAGFFLLAISITKILPVREANSHYKVYGDNKGVVGGWWNGRS
jgi:hypothetical protein